MNTFRIELPKYLVAGSLAFLGDFAVFLFLTEFLLVHYLISNAAGFCVGLTISYLLCVNWVFSHRTYMKLRVEFPVFAAISLIMLLFGELLLLVLVEYAMLSNVIAKVVMTGMVFIFNFILKKLILFQHKATI